MVRRPQKQMIIIIFSADDVIFMLKIRNENGREKKFKVHKFMPLFSFHTLRKQETSGFLILSGCIVRPWCIERQIGYYMVLLFLTLTVYVFGIRAVENPHQG